MVPYTTIRPRDHHRIKYTEMLLLLFSPMLYFTHFVNTLRSSSPWVNDLHDCVISLRKCCILRCCNGKPTEVADVALGSTEYSVRIDPR